MKFLCKPDPGIGSFLKLSDQPVNGCKADFWLVLTHPRKICSWVEITSPNGEEVG
jgi:sulfur transfer protein SufE